MVEKTETSENTLISIDPRMLNGFNSHDDEIDLFELWRGLLEEKWTIFFVTGVIFLAAVVFILFASKTYQVKTAFIPPLAKEIEPLKYPDIYSPDGGKFYQLFISKLNAQDLRAQIAKEIIKDNASKKKMEVDQVISQLDKKITVEFPVESKKLRIQLPLITTLSFEWNNNQQAYQYLNKYIQLVEADTKQQIRDNILSTLEQKRLKIQQSFQNENKRVSTEIEAEIKRLMEHDKEQRQKIKKQIFLLREKAEKSRQLQIERLKEDLYLAQQLGITTPTDPLNYNKRQKTSILLDTSNLPSSRNYWLGSEVLSSELKALESRKNNDPFISQLPELLQKLKGLDNNVRIKILQSRQSNLPFSDKLRQLKFQEIKISQVINKIKQARFNVFHDFEKPVKPTQPIKPKKTLILAVSLILGLMLSVFIALIRRTIKNRTQKKSVDSQNIATA